MSTSALEEAVATARAAAEAAGISLDVDPTVLDPIDGCGAAADPTLRVRTGYGRTYVVCVDATSGVRFTGFPQRQYLHPLPHQSVEVRVRHTEGDQVEVLATGTHGVYVPGIQPAEGTESRESKDVGHAAPSKSQSSRWDRFVFAPYQPGDLDLTVKLGHPEADATVLGAALDALQNAIAKAQFEKDSPGAAVETRLEAQMKALRERIAKAAGIDASDAAKTALAEAVDAVRAAAEGLVSKVAPPAVPAPSPAPAVPAPSPAPAVPAPSPAPAPAPTGPTAEQLDGWADAVEAAAAKVVGLPAAESSGTMDLTVDKTFVGTLRLGFAGIFGGAVDGAYGVGQAGAVLGSDAPNVLQSAGNGDADGELVLGYSQYLARRPQSNTGFRPAFYAAAGIAATGTAAPTVDLSALRSFHFGGELGWDLLSIGIGPALRRVTRLQDGFELGDTVGPSAVASNGTVTNVTEDRWQWGVSVVVFAPGLLKVGGSHEEPKENTPTGADPKGGDQ